MYPLATIPYAQIELHWNRTLTGAAEIRTRQLRGALGVAFNDDAFFHQHDPITGKLLYRYPHIQYRWLDSRGVILGWGVVAIRLLALPWLDLSLRLGEDHVVITDALLTLRQNEFAVGTRLSYYQLKTPALLFNQDNYRRYLNMNEKEQCEERDRLLVANILAALRGLNVNFNQQLYATFVKPNRQNCHYKGESLLGLRGVFISNAILPDGFAFGHAVSHGFGELIPYNKD